MESLAQWPRLWHYLIRFRRRKRTRNVGERHEPGRVTRPPHFIPVLDKSDIFVVAIATFLLPAVTVPYRMRSTLPVLPALLPPIETLLSPSR